jgi:putative nucleotidyltransferase with HDIG domain
MLDYADKLPTLPSTVVDVLRLLADEASNNEQVTQYMLRDQALVGKLLKIANSAYYGVSRRVSTVQQALLVLGRNAVRSLVIAAGAQEFLTRPQPGYGLQKGALWQHSWAAGQVASRISTVVDYRPVEEAFVAGLLHDIGKVVLNSYLAEYSEELAARLAEPEGVLLTELEHDLVQIDHPTLGGIVAEHWQLPGKLVHAIRFHHSPSDAGDEWQLAAVVHAANLLTVSLGVGLGIDGLHYQVDHAALDRLGLDAPALENLLGELVEDLAVAPAL